MPTLHDSLEFEAVISFGPEAAPDFGCLFGIEEYPASQLVETCSERIRRSWSDDEKRSICLQTFAPGVSAAQVARRYAMNANLIFKWLKDPRFQPGEPEVEESTFLPVEISTEPEAALPNVPQSMPERGTYSRSGPRIEIVTVEGHRLTVEGDFDGDALSRLLVS